MNPKQALIIVTLLVITGEAIAELFATYGTYIIGIGIVVMAALFIYSVKTSRK